MKNSVLSQQLPQENAKGIDVHSQCDRVSLWLLHGVLVLANSAQQLWGRIARVASLQKIRGELERTTTLGICMTGLALRSSHAPAYKPRLHSQACNQSSPRNDGRGYLYTPDTQGKGARGPRKTGCRMEQRGTSLTGKSLRSRSER